jgi:hypothetical protein
MGKFNSKFEQLESRTVSWNGLCSKFEVPLYTNKDIDIVITCLIGPTGEVSAGAELPPRNNPNDDKTSWHRHRASHATEPNGNTLM